MTIICIVLVVLFTYLNFRVSAYWLERTVSQVINTPAFLKKRWETEMHQAHGLFSYRFRIYLQTNIYYTFSILFIALAYRLLITWYLQEKNRAALENQKLQAELSYLHMQVNPHFLFNALNNIYSQSVLENSPLTGNSILKLSELLRYMLYEKTDANNKVSLENEIRHINNYIELEKMRHYGKIHLNFSIEGDMEGKRIAPLLLFPLVENACKHGILNDAAKPVTIQLTVTDNQLSLNLENFNNHHYKDKTGGIGIQNVQKRLDLIYGTNYTFEVHKTDAVYKLNLHVPL